jgi:hypothetical protein
MHGRVCVGSGYQQFADAGRDVIVGNRLPGGYLVFHMVLDEPRACRRPTSLEPTRKDAGKNPWGIAKDPPTNTARHTCRLTHARNSPRFGTCMSVAAHVEKLACGREIVVHQSPD